MHENARIELATAAPARGADFAASRLKKVTAAVTVGQLKPVAVRARGRALIVDLTSGTTLPSLAVGLAAATLRGRGDEVRVLAASRAAIRVRPYSQIASNAERSVERSSILGHGFGSRGFVVRTLAAIAGGQAESNSAADRLAHAGRIRSSGEVVLVAADAPIESTARESATGVPVADVAVVLSKVAQPPVADFSDYEPARLRVLPIAACHADGRARSADFVEHEVREHARRHATPDLVFVDAAMNADPAGFRTIVAGMQRNAPGVRWIGRVIPSADGSDDGLSRRDLRDAAASGLRRLTVSLERTFAGASDDGVEAALDRLARLFRESTASGIGVAVEVLGSKEPDDVAAAAMVARMARFLREQAAVIDRVRFGEARYGARTLASLRDLVDAAESINALPIRHPAPSFEAVR